MAWFNFPVTQDFGQNGETGRDYGTPNNTQVFFPVGGTVVAANYQVYGGQVAVAVPGKGILEYFIHLNDIFVKVGDIIKPGQIIGTTGGGVGDKILKNGTVQAATSQSDYQGHSSGYHTEFGLFKGSTATDFNRAWTNAAQDINPIPFTSALLSGGIAAAENYLGTTGILPGSPGLPIQGATLPGGTVPVPGLPDLTPVNNFFKAANDFITKTDWVDKSIRSGLVVGGIILVVVALFMIFKGGSNESDS